MAFGKKRREAAEAASADVPVSAATAEIDNPQDLFAEDPLESLLDEQSDEEFGDLELRDRAGKPVKLAEWSAQDFSSIYLRFRPHLERHARRFLRNPSQVDEVVQDAFLYLMVSLPELDSEIGVLRFLKWKTRLLALDVIRASSRAYIKSIDDVREPESTEPEISSHLEQQDDAAVVRLALSKLNPRHREVLIASMYEEKSTEQIASQVGLSENATRQLLFRARAAFKKALIGDVDTSGMSASAILSVAARKAAQETKKIGAGAMALIALVVLSLTVFPSLNRAPDQMVGSPEPTSNQRASTPLDSGTSQPSPDSAKSSDSSADAAAGGSAGQLDSESTSDPSSNQPSADSLPAGADSVESAPSPSETPFSDASLDKIFDAKTSSSLYSLDEKLVVFADNGISASFFFNSAEESPFNNVYAEFELDGAIYAAYPNESEWLVATDPLGQQRFVFFGALNYVYDEEGKVWSASDLAKGTLRIEVVLNQNSVKIQQVVLAVLSEG